MFHLKSENQVKPGKEKHIVPVEWDSSNNLQSAMLFAKAGKVALYYEEIFADQKSILEQFPINNNQQLGMMVSFICLVYTLQQLIFSPVFLTYDITL